MIKIKPIQNKRGWLRIMEAFVAIIMILAAVLLLFGGTSGKQKTSAMITGVEKAILNEISTDKALRQEVISLGEGTSSDILNTFISERIPVGFEFEFKACSLDKICSSSEYHPEVYVSESVISSTLSNYSPKKAKLFVWPVS